MERRGDQIKDFIDEDNAWIRSKARHDRILVQNHLVPFRHFADGHDELGVWKQD